MNDLKKIVTEKCSVRSGDFVFEWESRDGEIHEFCTIGFHPLEAKVRPQSVTLLRHPKKVLPDLELLLIKARAALGE